MDVQQICDRKLGKNSQQQEKDQKKSVRNQEIVVKKILR